MGGGVKVRYEKEALLQAAARQGEVAGATKHPIKKLIYLNLSEQLCQSHALCVLFKFKIVNCSFIFLLLSTG